MLDAFYAFDAIDAVIATLYFDIFAAASLMPLITPLLPLDDFFFAVTSYGFHAATMLSFSFDATLRLIAADAFIIAACHAMLLTLFFMF